MFGLHDRFLNEFFSGPSYSRRRQALPSRRDKNSEYGTLIPNSFFSDSLFNEPMVFNENFYNVENDVKLNEEADKYIISFHDENINKKELKVDFLKKENELRIQVAQKADESGDGNESHYSSSYQSSIRFDKAVKFEEIVADVNGADVSIVIPKVESDAANIVNIQVKGIENVKPIIESKPHESNTEQKALENEESQKPLNE